MAATIAYLQEWGWDTQQLMHWTRQETQLLVSNDITLNAPWWQIESLLYKEAQQQRVSTGIDWHVKLPERQRLRLHLKTWVQGALQFRDSKAAKPCPLCHAPATPKHIQGPAP